MGIRQKLLGLLRKPAEPTAGGGTAAVASAETREPVALDFEKIYRDNTFGSDESHSGEGSEMSQTALLRERLPGVFRELGVASMLDLPCGDFNWMKHVDLSGVRYIGGDIVREIIEKNTAAHAAEGREFMHLDLINDDLPGVDLVFTRDCLVHLPYGHIARAVENVRRSGATWLAATTFTRRHTNSELYGVWRPLNMQDAPFEFPEPEHLIEEGCPPVGGEDFSDKSMGFWRVADLPRVRA